MKYYSSMTENQQKLLYSFIEQSLPEQITALQSLVAIPSVKESPADGAPFGLPIKDALIDALYTAHKLGFEIRDIDGYAGVIEHGDGEETLGILAHLDVVPPGDGWHFPPFGGKVAGGRLYGRGAIDDKGPAISAMYALLAVKNANIPLKRKVQIILGCDEESGSECIEYFKKVEPAPTLSFSPDAEYPIVFSEKAILQATYRMPLHNNTAISITSGERPNVVPGKAVASLPLSLIEGKAPDCPDGFILSLDTDINSATITMNGVSAHASTPEQGKNALLALLQLLNGLDLPANDAAIIRDLSSAFKMDLHGEALLLNVEDESGILTLNPAIMEWDNDAIELTIDARIPRSLPVEKVINTLDSELGKIGLMLYSKHTAPMHHMPIDSELVSKLYNIYQLHSGDYMTKPLAIGGGTYARSFQNSVAFGCEWPGAPMVAHMPDEYIEIADMLRNTHIMADAIIALAGE